MSSAKRLSTYQAGSGVKKRKINKTEANRAKKLEVQAKEDEWNEYYAQLIEYGMEHDSYQVPLDHTVKTDDGKTLQLGAWLLVQGSRLTEYAKHYPQWYSDIMDIVETGKLWFDPDLTKNVSAAHAKLQNKTPVETVKVTPPAVQSSASSKPPPATKAILRDRAGHSDSESDSEVSQVAKIAVPIPKASAQAGPSKAATEPPRSASVAALPVSTSTRKLVLTKKGVAVSSTSKESAGTTKVTASSKASKGVVVDLSHSESDSGIWSEEEVSDDDYHPSREASAPARRSIATKSTPSQPTKAAATHPTQYSSTAAIDRIRTKWAGSEALENIGTPSASVNASSTVNKHRGRPPAGSTTPSASSKPAPPAVTPSKFSASKEKQKQATQAPPPPQVPLVPASMTRPSSSSHRTSPSTQADEPPLPPLKGITRPEQDPTYELNGVFPPRRTIVKPRPVPPTAEPEATPVAELAQPVPIIGASYKPVSVATIKALTGALANTKQAGALHVHVTSAAALAEPKIIVSTPPTSEPHIVLPPKQTHVESRPNGGSPRAYEPPQALYTDAKAGLQRRSIREAKQQSAPAPEDSQEYYLAEGLFADESKETPPVHREDSQEAPESPVPPLEAMDTPSDGMDIEMYEDEDLVVVGGRRGSPRGHVVKDSQTQSQPSQLEPMQLLLEDADGPTHQAFVAELCGTPSSSSHLSTGTADTDSEDEVVVQVSRESTASAPTTTAATLQSAGPSHTLEIVDDTHGVAAQSVTVTASQAKGLTSVSQIIQTAAQHASTSISAAAERNQDGPAASNSYNGSSITTQPAAPANTNADNADNADTCASSRQDGNGPSVIDVPASLEEIIGEDEDSDSDVSDDGSVKIIGGSVGTTSTDRNKEFVAFAYTRNTMGRDYAMLGIGMVCNYESDKDKLFLVVMRPNDPAHPANAEYVMEFEENVVVKNNVVLARGLAFEGGKKL